MVQDGCGSTHRWLPQKSPLIHHDGLLLLSGTSHASAADAGRKPAIISIISQHLDLPTASGGRLNTGW